MVTRAVVLQFGPFPISPGAFPLKMVDFGLGDMVNPPSRPLDPVAPIRLLKKKKVVLVKQSDLLSGLPPDHHARTDHRVHLNGLPIISLFPGKLLRKEPSQKAFVEKLRGQGRIISDRVLLRSVTIE